MQTLTSTTKCKKIVIPRIFINCYQLSVDDQLPALMTQYLSLPLVCAVIF